jgi:hypothetical protein
MMLTIPNPSLRRRLLDELLTEEGGLDWQRLQDLAALAAHDTAFQLETEGLVEPALDMILSPEGVDLRRALVSELLRNPESAAQSVDQLAPLLTTDQSLSGRAILDKLVAFLLSPEGEETRTQLVAGIRNGDNGQKGMDLARVMDLAAMAGRLHPEFRTSTVISSVGSYLMSEQGRPARNQILISGAQWVVGGITGALSRLAQPVADPSAAVEVDGDDQRHRTPENAEGVIVAEPVRA